MKYLNSFFVSLLLFSSSTLLAQDQLVQRRVLLVDFANLQNKADFEYLQISIPEAMLTALSDTKNFDLLPADTWSNLVDRGDFAAKDNRSDQKARNAGLSRGADVVVLGSFVNINQDLKITARAIETESGRVIVSKSVLAKTDGSMFGSIDKLSVDMAKEMKTKLPPLPPREIIREKNPEKEFTGSTNEEDSTENLTRPLFRVGIKAYSLDTGVTKSSQNTDSFGIATYDTYKRPYSALFAELWVLPYAFTSFSFRNFANGAYLGTVLSGDLGLQYVLNEGLITYAAGVGARYSKVKLDFAYGTDDTGSIDEYTLSVVGKFSIERSFGIIGVFLEMQYATQPWLKPADDSSVSGFSYWAGVSYRTGV